MVDPSDYLHAQLKIGSNECDIVNMNGKVLMTSRGHNDRSAIKNMAALIDEMIAERKRKKNEQ